MPAESRIAIESWPKRSTAWPAADHLSSRKGKRGRSADDSSSQHDANSNVTHSSTDGLIEQIGGPRSVAFGKQRFKAFIAANQHLPMSQQAERLAEIWADYQGQQPSRDDVTVMGFTPRAA